MTTPSKLTASGGSPHPDEALFAGQSPSPVLAPCEHYAGTEKFIFKALELQGRLGRVFDVTCDCEDGAVSGEERPHVQMVARAIRSDANPFGRVGARIHDVTTRHWKDDIEVLIGEAGDRIAYLTVPKCRSVSDAAHVLDHIRSRESAAGLQRLIPAHVLIETHGALRDVFAIAALPGIEVLDFGIMDFVSDHLGALPQAAMRSPLQFEHPLLVRAKSEIAAAALAYGLVPAHNVCTALRDTQTVYSDARRARDEFGFLRMWSVHPDQILPIVRAMSPESTDIEEAADVLLAASHSNWGPISADGRLHDRASYRYFWSVLRRAHGLGIAMPPAATAAFFSNDNAGVAADDA